MQGPTHLAIGVLIQQSTKNVRAGVRYPLIAVLALASHALLDKLAVFTYHPPTALVEDWFWISYHSLIALLSVFFLTKYWRSSAVGIIFSILPDIEWVVLYGSTLFSFKIPSWKEPILHEAFLNFLDFGPPFSLVDSLPDWRLEPTAAMVEVVILLALFTGIRILQKTRRPPTTALVAKAPPPKPQAASEALDWLEQLSVFQKCMDHEQAIRMSYQRLLTSLEVAMLGVVFTFKQLELITQLWLLPVAGITLCVIFGAACEFHARNYDWWRLSIITLVRGTILEPHFKEGKYGHPADWHPFFDKESLWGKKGRFGDMLIGHLFERGLVPAMMVVWLVVAWHIPSPFMVRFCCTLATWTWIILNFRYGILIWWATVVSHGQGSTAAS